MVNECRIDTGLCKKVLPEKHPPKTLGTRVSCKTGKRWAKGKTGIGLDEYMAMRTLG